MMHVSEILNKIPAVAMLNEARAIEKIAQKQHSRVGRSYPKVCDKPCRPQEWFESVEECKICKRKF